MSHSQIGASHPFQVRLPDGNVTGRPFRESAGSQYHNTVMETSHILQPLARRLGTLAMIAALGLSCGQRLSWPAVLESIREQFPDVRQLQTQELAEWLADPSRRPPLLLDARTEAEFEVSHLAGARHFPEETPPAELLETAGADQPVVVYCSVGYRSSAVARRLREAGFTEVYNLEGSIFKWANEGRPVYRQEQTVQEVHPYDSLWGTLLDRHLHSYGIRPREGSGPPDP